MTTRLIDDHLLFRRLFESAEEPAEARVATTGLWYHRFSRALASGSTRGSLSRMLGDVPSDIAELALARATELPEDIELVSLRTLGWPMARLLHGGVRLNLLSLEALAAAQHLDAEIWLDHAGPNPPLMEAAARIGVSVRLVGPA